MEFNSEERKASLLPPLRLKLSPLSLQFKDLTMEKIVIDDMIKHSTLDKKNSFSEVIWIKSTTLFLQFSPHNLHFFLPFKHQSLNLFQFKAASEDRKSDPAAAVAQKG